MGASSTIHRASARLVCLALGIVSAFSLLAVASANATTLGSTLTATPDKSSCGATTYTNTALGSGTLEAPFNGVLVRWRLDLAVPGGSYTYKLRVLRPDGGSSYTGAGTGPSQSAPSAGVNVLALAKPLPIQAGDTIGIDCPGLAPAPYSVMGQKGTIYSFFGTYLAEGEMGAASGNLPGDEVLINADLVGQPTVTSLSPSTGSTGGGTTVTISGTHLTEAGAVKFGSNAASSFTVDSETQITAVAPPNPSPAAVDTTVTNAAGTSATSVADRFTYRLGRRRRPRPSLASCPS